MLPHRRNPRWPSTEIRRHARGLEIQHDDGVGHHQKILQIFFTCPGLHRQNRLQNGDAGQRLRPDPMFDGVATEKMKIKPIPQETQRAEFEIDAGLIATQKICFAQFHAPMPEDGVSGGAVEVDIGQNKIQQVRATLETHVTFTHFQGDGFLL